jgi:hypothetical protein
MTNKSLLFTWYNFTYSSYGFYMDNVDNVAYQLFAGKHLRLKVLSFILFFYTCHFTLGSYFVSLELAAHKINIAENLTNFLRT